MHEQLAAVLKALWILPSAAILGGAMGFIRPVRRGLVPRSSHVIQTQVLLAIVGAIIIIVVGGNVARAFAIVGAAGLIRYRANIDDPKDAGVLLMALAVGLMTGTGLILLAVFSTAFVIGTLWLLESLEPVDRTFLELVIASKNASKMRPQVDHALRHRGVRYELRGLAPNELRYEVTVPFNQKLGKLTKAIRALDKDDEVSVEWTAKKPKVVTT